MKLENFRLKRLIKLVKLQYFPYILSAWFALTFLISFCISVGNGHVYPYFPFISDTGSEPPESCIFGQMLNVGAVLMTIFILIRHKQVRYAIKYEEVELKNAWNVLASLSGAIAALGISIVANFQETALLPVHLIGAGMIFGNGAVFLLLQTRITHAFCKSSYKHPEYWNGPSIFYFRLIVSIIFTILYFVICGCGLVALLKFTGETIIYWTDEHGGYYEHLAATISEWVMVTSFFLFIISFSKEFKSLEYDAISFKNNCKNKESEKTSKPNGISTVLAV